MSRPGHHPAIALALALAGAVLAAGCGSAAPASPGTATHSAPAAASLDTSLVTAAGTWAVAVMGGSAAQHNNFWQLFLRPAGSTRWKLVTPPGTADNGGLVLAGGGGQSLITGLRPSQDLTYTPLAVTGDGGQAWSSAGPLDAALADVPDALAPAPGSGKLLALLADGTARLSAPGYASWSTLASRQTLAATPPGRRCGLQNLTAAAFSPSGMPLLAGTCGRPGTAGILAYSAGTWQAAGPQLPAALAHQNIAVLRLIRTAGRTTALLAASAGSATSLLAGWLAGSGTHWILSAPFRLNGAKLTSTSPGPGGTTVIVLNGNRAETIAGPGASWQPLPGLPAGTATLAAGPAGGLDALAVHRARLTVWHLAPGAAAWDTTQTINVPIQFGSSS
jgi:hypothetical protein